MAAEDVAARVQPNRNTALHIKGIEHAAAAYPVHMPSNQAVRANGVDGCDVAACVEFTDGNKPIVEEVRSASRRLLPSPQAVAAIPCRERRANARQLVVGVVGERTPVPTLRVAVGIEGDSSALRVLVDAVEGLRYALERGRIAHKVIPIAVAVPTCALPCSH